MTADVSMAGVGMRFGATTALEDVTLTIEAGEFLVLLGPSGCGKTTLLSILGGFLSPTSGRVTIGGQDVTQLAPKHRPTTTVFQDYALFPHMNLADNVGFGLRMRGQSRRQRRKRAAEWLDLVGLANMALRRPHELSGGQRQRVALARALAVEPDVLLLDEPLGALDLKLRHQLQRELKAMQRKVGTTFVHVTHDQEEAMAMADRIVLMNAGRIVDVGTPESVYLQPASLFSADFMGEINRLPATPADGGLQTPLGPVPLKSDHAVTLCFRPESLGPTGDVRLGPARLVGKTFFGNHQRCQFTPRAAPELTLIAHLPAGVAPAFDEEVILYGSNPLLLESAPAASSTTDESAAP